MYFTIKKDGFTLFEILVAIAIGSIIVIGLFVILGNVMNAKTFISKKSSYMKTVAKTVSLMEKDIRCKIGRFNISNAFGVSTLSFYTTNSLRFAGSVPVKVSYYMENKNNKTYLVRAETNRAAGEDLTIELTDIFDKMQFKFYSNGAWTDIPSKIIRIYLYSRNGNKYVFTVRGMLGE